MLRRELASLECANYMLTIEDKDYPNRSDLRVFGKVINNLDIYIKLRVELVSILGKMVFVLSFHESERSFFKDEFPYRS